MRNEEQNKPRKDILDSNIIRASLLGIGLVVALSVAFRIELTLVSVLIGILLGGLIDAYVRLSVINQAIVDSKLRMDIDNEFLKILSNHHKWIKELENKIEELEEGRQ